MAAAKSWFEPGAIAVFLAIALPWHLAASLTEPIFGWFYFINEHVLRFLGKREPHDYYTGPWWHYLPRMAVYLFPWSFLLPALTLRRASKEDNAGALRLRRFLWVAWMAPLIFFSISRAKANYYLIAVMPFAAFHLACTIEDREWRGGLRRALPGLLIAAVAGLLCVLAWQGDASQGVDIAMLGLKPRDFLVALFAGMAALALASALVAAGRVRNWMLPYLTVPVWAGAGVWLMLQAMEPLVSTRPIAQYLQRDLPGRKVYLYRWYEQKSSLPFYLKHPVPVIDARSDDLFWGNKLRANDIVIPAEAFRARMASQPVAVVVPDRQLRDFRGTGFFPAFKGEKRIGDTTVFFN